MRGLQYVSHKQVYDLVFRARNAKLNSAAYALEFLDWVKAGVAFNTRGCEVPSRKIAYFAKLYRALESLKERGLPFFEKNRGLFEEALCFYYEDIFDIYRDHLKAKQAEAGAKTKKRLPDFEDLYILPSFELTPEFADCLEKEVIPWDEYNCINSAKVLEQAGTVYLDIQGGLFRCMSLMHDYGIARCKTGVLLEVSLWQ